MTTHDKMTVDLFGEYEIVSSTGFRCPKIQVW